MSQHSLTKDRVEKNIRTINTNAEQLGITAKGLESKIENDLEQLTKEGNSPTSIFEIEGAALANTVDHTAKLLRTWRNKK
jgi:hypothetical protein